MPFVKLDCAIMDSALWRREPDELKLWIYLLVRADGDGFVNICDRVIAFHCGIREHRATDIINRLCTPDEDGAPYLSRQRVGITITPQKRSARQTHDTLRLSGYVWMKLKASIFKRDDYTCQYCQARGVRLECDHVMPISRGGTNSPRNLKTACVRCNRSKRDKTPQEWMCLQ